VIIKAYSFYDNGTIFQIYVCMCVNDVAGKGCNIGL
jgi:hypothetical protein